MNIKNFKELPILAILRGITKSQVIPVFQVAYNSGIRAIEITLNTKYALNLISEAVSSFENKMSIGAGTVLTVSEAEAAIKSGATFIVSPNFSKNVANYCMNNNVPYFPGALTPTEILNAWENGATMVKVFPAYVFGPKYFGEIKAPLNKVELMAVSGVKPDNMIEYFDNGADAVAVGGSVFRKDWLESDNWDLIKNSLLKYVNKYKEYAKTRGKK